MPLHAPFYAPGEKVDLSLAIHDLHNNQPRLKGSVLQILRADNSIYSQFPVPDMAGERITLSIIAPATSGEWRMHWVDASGTELDSKNFRVAVNPDAPTLTLSVDRKMISDVEPAANITINAVTHRGKPVAYLSGRITAKWVGTSKLFPGWDDYRFGVQEDDIADAHVHAHFITDGDGVAHLRLDLIPPKIYRLQAPPRLMWKPILPWVWPPKPHPPCYQ